MGIQKDLHLVGNDFSNIATFLFVGLLCFEVPNSTLFANQPSLNHLTFLSLFSPDGPRSEMAWPQCDPLGYRNSQW
jgi:hypothetical protein